MMLVSLFMVMPMFFLVPRPTVYVYLRVRMCVYTCNMRLFPCLFHYFGIDRHLYLCMCEYINTYMHACRRTDINTHLRAYVHTYIYRLQIQTLVFMYARIHKSVHACIQTYRHKYIPTCVRTYIHIQAADLHRTV